MRDATCTERLRESNRNQKTVPPGVPLASLPLTVSLYSPGTPSPGNLGLSRDPFLHVTAWIAARHHMWCVNQKEERKTRFEIIKGENLLFPCLSLITCHQAGCLSACVSMCMLERRLWTAWLWLCAADTWVSCLTLASIHLCFSTVKSLSCVVCMQSPHVNIVMLSLKSKACRSNSGFAVRLWWHARAQTLLKWTKSPFV